MITSAFHWLCSPRVSFPEISLQDQHVGEQSKRSIHNTAEPRTREIDSLNQDATVPLPILIDGYKVTCVFTSTYDHRSVKTGHPVRSAIHKH